MTTEEFVSLALKAFALGYSIGFIHWGVSFCCRFIRKTFYQAMRIADL